MTAAGPTLSSLPPGCPCAEQANPTLKTPILHVRVRAHRFVDRVAMADQIAMRRDELLERRVDVVEINVGDEAVDACINAGRLRAKHESLLADQAGHGR